MRSVNDEPNCLGFNFLFVEEGRRNGMRIGAKYDRAKLRAIMFDWFALVERALAAELFGDGGAGDSDFSPAFHQQRIDHLGRKHHLFFSSISFVLVSCIPGMVRQ